MKSVSAQGLRGTVPDDYRGSYADYQNDVKRSLLEAKSHALPAAVLHFSGLSWLAAHNDDEYVCALMNEASPEVVSLSTLLR